jgi:pilus assembly protein CpaE
MYPFQALLISSDDALADQVARELQARSVGLEQRVTGVIEAESWLAAAPETKRLFILHVPDTSQLQPMRRLRGICVGQPILVLMPDADTDKETLIRLMRAGADQAVLLPLQADDFSAALDSLAWQFGYPADSAPVVAVTGVSAATGATTVALNLAYELAQRGKDCILVEMSTCLGKLAGRLGVQARFTTRDLALARERLDAHMIAQALVPVTEHLRLLAAPADQVKPVDLPNPNFRKLYTHFRQLADVTVLDVNFALNELHFKGLAAADQVLLVGQQSPALLQDLKLMCRTLRDEYGIAALRPVINRYAARHRSGSLDQMREALEESRLWTIAADSALSSPRSTDQPLRIASPRSPALADIQALAGAVLGEPTPPRSDRRGGWLGWLTGAFSGGGS